MPDVNLERCRRESTPHGPDYCAPCSELLQEWVAWEGHRELVRSVAFLREHITTLEEELQQLEEIRDAAQRVDDLMPHNMWPREHLFEAWQELRALLVSQKVTDDA